MNDTPFLRRWGTTTDDDYRSKDNWMLPMTANSEGLSDVQPVRRKGTTVLGVALLALGVLGLLTGFFLLVAPNQSQRVIFNLTDIPLVHAILAGLSKLALCFLAVCLLSRRRRTNIVALACLTLSLIDSAFFQLKVVPRMRLGLHPDLAAAISMGGWISMTVTALLYGGICYYLDRPATRKEFKRTTA